jgi:hypothetical protein
MKQVFVSVVLLSASVAFAGTWCHIGTAMVMCPKPPTHAHELVSNLHIAARVR